MTTSQYLSVPLLSTCRRAGLKMQGSGGFPSWQILTIIGCIVTAAAADQSGDFIYTDNGPDITITGYAVGAPPVVNIPATIVISQDPLVEKTVASVGISAFAGRTELTSVTIPIGVTNIGNFAFSGCSKLVSATIPSTVTAIGRSAFSFCIALTGMSLPEGLTSIGNSVFGTCTALTSVTLPSTLTTMGQSVFGNCTSLLSVTIPPNVTNIPISTFNGCSGLTSVSLPSTLISIGASAFQSCIALTSVSIPGNVTTLSSKAFANCRGLTTIAIPASVTSIATEVFRECSSLTSISVDGTNPTFSDLNGVLFNKLQTRLIAFPPGRTGTYALPATVATVGAFAFATCVKLIGVTFPNILTGIEARAFSTCGKLTNAVFTGDPPVMGSAVFELAGPGFAIGYLTSGTGFTSPDWECNPGQIYPAYQIAAITPEFTWLYSNGVPGNSDFLSDTNGDGVNLLMAYALNLDPNARNSLPQPVFGASQMSLSFYAGAPGVTYAVQASDDLVNWSADGVTLSAPDLNQIRTGTVQFSGPPRFMRLAVSH